MINFIPEAILSIKPNSEFIVGETYASLDWHSKDQDKPTEAEFDEALASYDRAIELEPNNTDAYSNRGLTLHKLNRLNEALASYDRAIKLKPDKD